MILKVKVFTEYEFKTTLQWWNYAMNFASTMNNSEDSREGNGRRKLF